LNLNLLIPLNALSISHTMLTAYSSDCTDTKAFTVLTA